jgi:hypothetical protein
MRFTKDPNAVLDFTIDWESWLDGDTISASTWTPEAGITVDSDTDTDTTTTVWLSGGTAGQSYRVTNHITTAAGREEDRTLIIKVLQQ